MIPMEIAIKHDSSKVYPPLMVFSVWLKKQATRLFPKSDLARTISYCLTQKDKLVTFSKIDALNSNNRADSSFAFRDGMKKLSSLHEIQVALVASSTLYSLEVVERRRHIPLQYLIYLNRYFLHFIFIAYPIRYDLFNNISRTMFDLLENFSNVFTNYSNCNQLNPTY